MYSGCARVRVYLFGLTRSNHAFFAFGMSEVHADLSKQIRVCALICRIYLSRPFL